MDQAEYQKITESVTAGIQKMNSRIDTVQQQTAAIQKQTDAIDQRTSQQYAGAYSERKTLRQKLEENEGFQRVLRDRKGNAILNLEGNDIQLFDRKTTLVSSGVGWQTTGVLPIERIPGITPEARATLRVRDVLPASPTSYQVIDFVRVTTPPLVASPAPENTTKLENAVGFTSYSERVKTIATWLPASKQIMDDFSELSTYIENMLPYEVNLAEEIGLLTGDGVGETLHGIIPQATAFNTGLLVPASGYTRIDVIGRAIEQINMTNELDPSFVIMNPRDWWSLRLTKDLYGRYLLGDPSSQTGAAANVFGLQAVWTPSMPVGQFVVGSGSPVASEIRDRMQMQVELSSEHGNFFVLNLVAVRAEKRLAYIMKRPGSFVTGSLTSSPIS